jgi:hypothetical protein
MAIITDPRIEEYPELAQAVHKANEVIEEMFQDSLVLAAAEWQLVGGKEPTARLTLRLVDYAESAQQEFNLETLQDKRDTWSQLYRLWGKLLGIESRKILKNLLESVGKEE